jgi:membrane protein
MDQAVRNTENNSGIKQVFSILYQSIKDLIRDDGPQWAAAIAYYSLLSIFPLLLAAASIASFFVNPTWAIDQASRLLGSYLPKGGAQIADIIKSAFDARGSVSIISLMLLLWSGSRVFGVLTKAINIAFDAEKHYSFLKRIAVELIMAVTIGMLFLVALISRSLILFLGQQLAWFPSGQNLFFRIGLLVVPGLLLLVVFFLIYRYTPRYEVNKWAAFYGALFATVLFLAARVLFLGYLSTFTSFNLIYGSLAIVVVLMIWTWLVALIVLLGGELTAQIQNGNQHHRASAQHSKKQEE